MNLLASIPAHVKIDWAFLLLKIGWVDIVLVAVFSIGVFLGLNRGLAKALPKLAEVVFAQVVTIEYYETLAQFLKARLPIPLSILEITVFAGLAVGSIVIARILFQLMSALGKVDFKSLISNVGGALVSGLQYYLLLSLILSFIVLFPLPSLQESFTSRSISGGYLVASTHRVHSLFRGAIPQSWRTS